MKLALCVLAASFTAAASDSGARALDVTRGSASFEAATNVPAVSVHGKSSELSARLLLKRDGTQLHLQDIEAAVDPATLTTGMGVRDQHMRDKVLKSSDGSLPPIRFVGENVVCPAPEAGKQICCAVAGTMYMRGAGKPFRMDLKVKAEGKDGLRYRVSGEGALKLTAYGLEPPSQFGVRVGDEVKVKVEFETREAARQSARVGQ